MQVRCTEQPGLADGQGTGAGRGRHASRRPRFFLEPFTGLGAPGRGAGSLGRERYRVPYSRAELKVAEEPLSGHQMAVAEAHF